MCRRLRARAKGKGDHTAVWLDELPRICGVRWSEIVRACGQHVVALEVVELDERQRSPAPRSTASDSCDWRIGPKETLHRDAGLELAEGIFDEPLTTEKLALARTLYNDNLLSRATILHLEQQLGLLQPGRTVEQELKDIDAEAPKAPPVPGPNDLANGLPFPAGNAGTPPPHPPGAGPGPQLPAAQAAATQPPPPPKPAAAKALSRNGRGG